MVNLSDKEVFALLGAFFIGIVVFSLWMGGFM
jgi:hypothetical protein